VKLRFFYTINGTGADGETWTTNGWLDCEPGSFHLIFDKAMSQTFEKLTQGKAAYGHPGQGGCRGPYSVKKVVIEEVGEQG